MARSELRISGFGGQGVVLSGQLIGRAAAINAGMHATMIQSFGPEARGSACSATLVISDEEILYPYITHPDILVAMSLEGYTMYRDELKDDGILIYEQDLVQPSFKPGQRAYGIPSTRFAEDLGRALVQNTVMVGFFTGVAGVVPAVAMREVVRVSVPPGTVDLNMAAFERGLEHARHAAATQEQSMEVTA